MVSVPGRVGNAIALALKAGALFSGIVALSNVRELVFPRTVKSERLYTPKEVARYLRVEEADVLVLIERGELNAKRINGKYIVLGKSVIAFLATAS